MAAAKKAAKTSAYETEMERSIRARADFALAALGMAIVRNGSGRFLNIRATDGRQTKRKRTETV